MSPDEQPMSLTEPEVEGVEMVACGDCGTEVPVDDTQLACDKSLCLACFQSYHQCERCEGWTSDSTHTVYCGSNDEEEWCSSCVDAHTTFCTDCESLIRDRLRTFTIHTGEEICQSCRNNSYFRCGGCGELFQDSDEYSGYCSSCYEDDHDSDEDEDRGPIRDYNYKPLPIFHGREAEMFYGVELEVNTSTSTADETLRLLKSDADGGHAYLKQDSTIDSGGYEIVTHPHTLAEHRKLWKPFFKDIPAMTGYKTGECGMHIHINRKQLTELQIRKMLVFINAPENLHFIIAMAQRDQNTYCKIQPKKLTDVGTSRYEALNVCNKNTVEVRLFRSTVRSDRFFKNLEFVDATVRWTRNTSYRDLTYKNFIAHVNNNQKDYPNLFNYLVECGYSHLPTKRLLQEIRRCA